LGKAKGIRDRGEAEKEQVSQGVEAKGEGSATAHLKGTKRREKQSLQTIGYQRGGTGRGEDGQLNNRRTRKEEGKQRTVSNLMRLEAEKWKTTEGKESFGLVGARQNSCCSREQRAGPKCVQKFWGSKGEARMGRRKHTVADKEHLGEKIPSGRGSMPPSCQLG